MEDTLRYLFASLHTVIPDVLEACGNDAEAAFEKLQQMQACSLASSSYLQRPIEPRFACRAVFQPNLALLGIFGKVFEQCCQHCIAAGKVTTAVSLQAGDFTRQRTVPF